MNNQTPLTHADLRQFTGDLERFRHGLNRRVIYTPGMQYLAEKAGAYWLIDAIASYLGSPQLNKAIAADARLKYFQLWCLDVLDDGAVLTCRVDDDVDPAIYQDIEYTDFPLDHIDVWVGFDNEYWTLYLPSEH